ncbi:AMP-binding protein [Dongia sp.]|uniref:AMP-binding protein n=1 Tax=Dongia sp. TaxID=1977262 RepID=UPI0035B3EE90
MGVSFVTNLQIFGGRVALAGRNGNVVTYAALSQMVTQRQEAFGPTRRLIFWSASNDPSGIASYLAALVGGHVILPLGPACNDEARRARQNLIEIYQPDLIIDGAGDHWRDRSGQYKELHPDLALLLSTSGSTGTPKLVRLSAAGIDDNARAIADYLELTPEDRSALVLPLHYSYGLSVLHAHLSVGASLYLGHASIRDAGFLVALAETHCTNLSGVPHSFELLEEIGFRQADLPDLRFLTVAGGRLGEDKVTRYAEHMRERNGAFFVMYGQTEATARMAYLPPAAAKQHPDCIGIAIPGGELRLLNENGSEITAANQTGELVYRGRNVMMGYAETIGDLGRGHDLFELRTGDLAERTSAGFYRLKGRQHRFSKIAGLRISHDALEAALAKRNIVAAVTGDDDTIALTLTEAASCDSARGVVLRLTGLPARRIRCHHVETLPRRANGKIDYALIRRANAETGKSEGCSACQSANSGNAVMVAFAETFAPRRLRGSDSFASIGGDSLAYIEMTLALKPLLEPLPQEWERLSIDRLAELAARHCRPARTPLFVHLDTDLFLRAIAILAVVLHHATRWNIAGGAAILLMLLGYNLARHHRDRLARGAIGATLRACARPIALYLTMLMAYDLASGGAAGWQSLLLVGNLGIDGYSTTQTPLITFWFVEVYAQILVLLAALFTLPAVRRVVGQRPFATGLTALAVSVVMRPVADQFIDLGDMRYFFTPRVLYVAVLGWCIACADTPRRKAAMTVIIPALLVGLPLIEGAAVQIVWVRAILLISASLLMLWAIEIPLPRILARLLSGVAAASFSIYLLHTWPYFLWLKDAGYAGPIEVFLYIVCGAGSGLVIHHLLRTIRRGTLWRFLPRSLATKLET